MLGLIDAVIGESLIPDAELSSGWREAITAIARRALAVAIQHPWWVRAGSPPIFGPNTVRHVEQSARAISSAGLSPRESLIIVHVVDEYVFGHAGRVSAVREFERLQRGDDQEWRAFLNELTRYAMPHERFPLLEQWADVMVDISEDELFEHGLNWLLDGIAAWIERRA